ncbi:MAG: glutamate--tRNA ligase [Candidatus Hydrogenedentes bacterium]|nr:glutamate--tRNA ligase [Candidatus Hydrogenedentota bacterium]
MTTVRCRIAPSPSGFLHIGTAKIALFNWLYARKTGGKFVLRLEDTDAERTEEEFVQAMCAGFKWLGIEWDEGPEFGDEPERGPFAPYRQSERKALHQEACRKLLASGHAYRCYCGKEELEAEKEQARAEGRNPHYSRKCRDLTPEQIAAKGDAPFAVRFRVPEGFTEVHDVVQGVVRMENTQIDDFVIQKSNGDPIFHLAVVVDDGEMQITHVIRGDDHLTNAAKHVLLFNGLGYALPVFAHLPMVLDESGKKYSKRLHGANVLDWRDDGYLPEALINYVALLGWTPEEEGRELFTLTELIAAFDPRRWGKSAARFDLKKLQWLNGQHIRNLSLEALLERLLPRLRQAGCNVDSRPTEWLLKMTALCREKLTTLNDIVEVAGFFFSESAVYDEKGVKKQWGAPESLTYLTVMSELLWNATSWEVGPLHQLFEDKAAELGISIGKLMPSLRLALTGKTGGPDLFAALVLLGRDSCLRRIENAKIHIQSIRENIA